MIASAFSALALSGELPIGWLAFTLLGGAVSYFIEPTRQRLPQTRVWMAGWNLATLAVFVWILGEVIGGEPLILCGVRFLCFLLINKLSNRRASKDYQQSYVVSFLMLVGGTILNTDLVYALCFVAYVVFATWTLTLFHLRREMEENYLLKHSDDAQSERVEVERILNSRRVIGGAFLAGTSLVSVGIFATSAIIFFLFPRVGFGLFFQSPRPGMRVGFNDKGVELGQNGVVKDNPQVVMRIEFPDGKPMEPLYFRGVAFEHYDRTTNGKTAGWIPSPQRERRELPRVENLWIPVGRSMERKEVRKRVKGALRQQVYLEPMGDVSAIFAASSPVGLDLPQIFGDIAPVAPDGDALGDVFLSGRHGGLRYMAYSDVRPPNERLLAAEPDLPSERYEELRPSLQVPADLPPRVIALGRTITQNAHGPYEKARAVARYLRDNYRYTTQLGRDLRYDPLEDFLFVQKAGHCEYFATAMAILLRVVGVPTRHVAGFYGGDWNQYGKYLQVRQADAHAWVEVYMGDAGWVLFDPTPPSVMGAKEPTMRERMAKMIDIMQLAWFKYVIEYDLNKQMDLVSGARRFLSHRGANAKRTDSWIDWVKRHPIALPALLGLALAIVFWRKRGMPLPLRATDVRRQRALHGFSLALRALERRGLVRGSSETPAELALRARRKNDPGAAAFGELVALYYAARFGGATIDAAEMDRLVKQVVHPEVEASARQAA